MKTLSATQGRTIFAGLCVLGLAACHAKAPSVGTLRGNSEGAEASSNDASPDAEDVSDATNGPKKIADSGSGPATSSSDSPKPDEEVVPPVNTTGSNGDKKPNDPNQIIGNGRYFIKSSGAMKCLSIQNFSRSNGMPLQQSSCDVHANTMKFVIEYLPAFKAYTFVNVDSQKFLEVKDQNEVVQGGIQQNDFFGLPHQMFLIEKKEDNRYYIRSKNKKLFLDVTGASTADSALIQLWGDGNVSSSVWIFEPTL